MTQSKLEKLLKLWQKRLRLQDWDIEIALVPKVEGVEGMSMVFGGTMCRPSMMEASVQILNNLEDYDTELTLVHELLHVVFGGMQPPDGLFDHMFEVGVEKVARTLMGAYENT